MPPGSGRNVKREAGALSEAVLRDAFYRCDFAPQGCKLLGVEISFGIISLLNLIQAQLTVFGTV